MTEPAPGPEWDGDPEQDDDGRHRADWRRLGRLLAAHVVMLRDVDVLDDAFTAAVLVAADAAAGGAPPVTSQPSALAAAFDERIDALLPAAAVGAAGIGRAHPESVAALVRLATRDRLLALDAAAAAVRGRLLNLADAHAFTLMPAVDGWQPVAVSTLAHLLGGTVAPLGRAATRVRAAYATANRSPLGAGVLAGVGLPIDRERVAALLGCDEVVPNTFDAVAAVDHLVDAAEAAAAAVAPVSRIGVDLITWLRAEPQSFRLPDAWRSPVEGPTTAGGRPVVGLASLVTDARRLDADALGIRLVARQATYGPATVTVDALAAPLARLLDEATKLLTSFGDLVIGLEVNRAYLGNRAGREHTTSGELADYLMAEEGVGPGAARTITAMVVRRALEAGIEASGITPEMIDAAALMVLGRELGIEPEAIGRHLAPRRVLERRTATGAAGPAATRAYLGSERERLAADEQWRATATARLTAAAAELARSEAEIIAAVG